MAYTSPDQLRRERLQKWGTGPTREVRPQLPSNFDAAQKDARGVPSASPSQYAENNRKMYTMEDVPQAPATTNRWQAPGIGGAMQIAGLYGGLNRPSTEADAFTPTARQQTAEQFTKNAMRGAYPSTDRPAVPLWGPSTEADAFSDPRAPSVMPSAWQTGQLGSAKARPGMVSQLDSRPKSGARWGTALDQRPDPQDSARQTMDYYARKDARKDASRGGNSRRSDLAF